MTIKTARKTKLVTTEEAAALAAAFVAAGAAFEVGVAYEGRTTFTYHAATGGLVMAVLATVPR